MICLSDINKSDVIHCFDNVIKIVVKPQALSNKEILTHEGNEDIEHGYYKIMNRQISPDGTKTNMTYDAKGHLISVKVNGITRQKNSYDTKGNLTETEDALSRKTRVSYNSRGHAEKITAPDGSVTELKYDDKGNITGIKDPAGEETGYAYDALNRVTETRDGNGNKTRYGYNSLDKIVSVINPEGKERKYTYNASGRVESIADFDGGVIRTEYNSLNKPMAITDKLGRTIKQYYDKMWNLEELPEEIRKREAYREACSQDEAMSYEEPKPMLIMIDDLDDLYDLADAQMSIVGTRLRKAAVNAIMLVVSAGVNSLKGQDDLTRYIKSIRNGLLLSTQGYLSIFPVKASDVIRKPDGVLMKDGQVRMIRVAGE